MPHTRKQVSGTQKTSEHLDGTGSEAGPFTCFYEATKSLSCWGYRYSWTTWAPLREGPFCLLYCCVASAQDVLNEHVRP